MWLNRRLEGVQPSPWQAINGVGAAFTHLSISPTCQGAQAMSSSTGPPFSQSSYSLASRGLAVPASCRIRAASAGVTTPARASLPDGRPDLRGGHSGTAVPNFNIFVVMPPSNRGPLPSTVTTYQQLPDYFTYTVTSCDPGRWCTGQVLLLAISDGRSVGLHLVRTEQCDVPGTQATGQITATGPLELRERGLAEGTSVQFSQPSIRFQVCQSGFLPCWQERRRGESMTYFLGSVTSRSTSTQVSGETADTRAASKTSARQRLTVSALKRFPVPSTTANVNVCNPAALVLTPPNGTPDNGKGARLVCRHEQLIQLHNPFVSLMSCFLIPITRVIRKRTLLQRGSALG
ncbi:hypothetical protein BV898_13093 [Hypsibius exemplaris]|uniref:Uncharacterized protein n=1 Tax=Hypsibius exemplaris TaxID=2072580 RepID=A0A1W0WBU1_HYPEX|nr:hypothetical protein BV898_13093 [Hypsibius exemplaris]